MKRIVQVVADGQAVASFYIHHDPPVAYWRVEVPGREPYFSPLRVKGDETPEFFRRLAKLLGSKSEPDAPARYS